MSETERSPETFEQAMTELEEVVANMETGKLGLEESIVAYERGVRLLSYCRRVIAEAERRIELFENGEVRDLPDDLREGQ
jgi:exodeoxyribonuclease VII small subunit